MRSKIFLIKNKRWLLGVITAAALASSAPADPQPAADLSIRILEKLNPTVLSIQSPAGQGPWDAVKLSRGFLSVNGKALTSRVWGSPGGFCAVKIGALSRVYPGRLSVSLLNEGAGDEIQLLNSPDMIDYTACVAAAESGDPKGVWPEYDKALAALIRLYALTHRGRHLRYDYCDLAHCLLYPGVPKRMDYWKTTAQSASSIPAPAPGIDRNYYFHRNCGGSLDCAADIWGGVSLPAGRKTDELNGEILCGKGASFRWKTSAPAAPVEKALAESAGLPPDAGLESWKISQTTPGGRAKTFDAVFQLSGGPSREVQVNVQKFISQFGKENGWRVFPSAWFSWRRDGDHYLFSGRGQGHGVGLCQDGALALAQKGWDWRRILNFYFPDSNF